MLRRPCDFDFVSSLPPSAFRLPTSRRPAFTLIELLIVVTIIAVLAAALMFALFQTQEKAKADKTKALIARLDTIVRAKWESYQTRRVPIRARPRNVTEAAQMKHKVLHELMRMELPDRWYDVTDEPTSAIDYMSNPDNKLKRPAISQKYLRRYNAVYSQQTPEQRKKVGLYQGAECLFLICTTGLTDEVGGRELFSEGDIADVDGDGFHEFIDGWGNPIRFLRWAPGFPSELQPLTTERDMGNGRKVVWGDPKKNHDPFDPRRINPWGFALYPLIYSAGPDQTFDILNGYNDSAGMDAFHYSQHNNDPYYVPPDNPPRTIGTPMDLPNDKFDETTGNGAENWQDNIHNHLMTAR
jgi:prepilin-type N-terminal cleavage/methylation domain-containing protein